MAASTIQILLLPNRKVVLSLRSPQRGPISCVMPAMARKSPVIICEKGKKKNVSNFFFFFWFVFGLFLFSRFARFDERCAR